MKDYFHWRMQGISGKLNQVSASFCVAKWQQVTIHLATGKTHSCHHPKTHKIPINEIALNPSALHNTNYKKQQRRKMLDGERPSECDYCWRVEDAPGNHYSDRLKKSGNEIWGEPYLEASANMPWDADVVPAYVEVSFSNVCNFACGYCSPEVSSTLQQTVARHGPLKLTHSIEQVLTPENTPIPNREHNPYIDAWWRWWPTLYPALKVFRITGGEPLLSKETFRTLDWIIANPNPELELAINTNLGVEDRILDEFLRKCRTITENKLIKKLVIFTSCDTAGSQAEYTRVGLNYRRWLKTVDRINKNYKDIQVYIMCTFNLLSMPGIKQFLTDITDIRRINQSLYGNLLIDLPYLRYPHFLSSLISTEEQIRNFAEVCNWVEQEQYDLNSKPEGFYPQEVDGMFRILRVLESADHSNAYELKVHRADFYLFTEQHKQRTGFDFLEYFPEMQEFYLMCKQIYLDSFAKKTAEAKPAEVELVKSTMDKLDQLFIESQQSGGILKRRAI